MSGISSSNRPTPAPQKPADPKPAPSAPTPPSDDDAVLRDEQSGDGWHKTDGPGSGGGYGILGTKDSSVLNDDGLFTDRVDIKFPSKK